MKLKKLLAGVLTGALVLTLVNTNVGVAASEIAIADLTCEGWWTDFTDGIEISSDEQLEITGITTNNSTNNWNNMIYILFSGDGTVNGTDYLEYFVGRADDYGWGTATYEVTSYPSDWDAWLAATQEGAAFTVVATYTDEVIAITSSCEGAEYTATYTVEDSSLSYYIALSGEVCELTDLSYTVTAIETETEAATEEATEAATGDTTEEATETTTEETSETASEDTTEEDDATAIADLTCESWWTDFTDGIAIGEDQQVVITGATTNLSTNNWNNMIYILYSGDGTVNGTDYAEYFVGRADDYGWGAATYEVTSYPTDWDAWLAATQEGAEFTVTATYTEGTITVTSSCEGAEYTATYAVADSSLTYYIALTGEVCELTDLCYTVTSLASEDESETATEEETETTTEEETETTSEEATEATTEEETETTTEEETETTTEEETETTSEEVTETTTEEETETTTEEATETTTEEDDATALADLTCTGWWTDFTDGIAIGEEQQVVITGVTTNNSTNNWNNMIYILFSGDGTVNGTDYAEYFVGRADDYGWGTATYEVTSYPTDWDAWLAATQAGAEFTITATYTDGTITITSSCEGAEYTATYAVDDSSLTYYVSLSGELCELTDLTYTVTSLATEDTEIEEPGETESEEESETETESESEAETESEDVTEPEDTETEDTDTETEDTEAEDTEAEDAETEDTEAEDTDTEAEDTEAEDAETEDTEAEDTEAEGTEASTEAEETSSTLTTSSSDGTAYYAITIDSADSSSYLIVEVSDASGAYIYADSNGTCYFVSADGEMTEITDYEGDILSLTSGEVYNVTVDYDGTDVVISFYNEDGEVVLAYTVADTGMDDEITTTLSASEDAVITVDDAEVVTESGTEEDTNSEESTDTDSTDTETTGSGDSSNVISTGDSSSTATGSASPKTGDATPIIPIAVAILGCAAVVFASKKRMA